MAIKARIKDADTGNDVEMELSPGDSIESVIESAVSYWQKREGAYVLKYGDRLLRGKMTVAETRIVEDAHLELMLDPEGG